MPHAQKNNAAPAAPEAQSFKLVKYFSFSGFLVIFVFTLMLSFTISQQAKSMLLDKSQDYARLVAENLNHQVFLRHVIPIVEYQLANDIRLSREDKVNSLDQVVRSTIHGFHVQLVNIYDKDGTVIYSTSPELIETRASDTNPAFQAALADQTTSTLVTLPRQEGGQALTRIKELRTFSPFKAEKPVYPQGLMGVFEIHQDLTGDYAEIASFQRISMITSVLVMMLLFIVLRQIVRRAEVIIEDRAQKQRQLEKKLNESERLATLGRMVAAVSHEIRNPLGIVSSTAEILSGKMKNYEPGNMLADVIVDESRRLNRVVTEFLDFARPTEPNLAPCRLKDILDQNLSYLTPEIDRKNLTVIRRYLGPAVIEADKDQLYRAFLNIFLNAIQAAEPGGTIWVRTTPLDGLAEITISDDGPGLAEGGLDAAFTPFYTTKPKGSGLGLAIVRNIVEAHKGTVWLEAGAQGGATVVFRLPRNRD